ncbi:MAG TPA: thioredoxin family protein [Pyrinomonadaceae bacterium]|nr:thioredoxin family protein [Pyrinomonadaceae bacterium]
MTGKRKIEVFTAGCSLCEDTVRMVKEAVSSCGCEVIERRCSPHHMCDEGKAYGVRAMPTLVVNGAIIFEGRITREQAALLAR